MYDNASDSAFERKTLGWTVLWFLLAVLAFALVVLLIFIAPSVLLAAVVALISLCAMGLVFSTIYMAVWRFRTNRRNKNNGK